MKQILADPSFEIPTSEAREAKSCAFRLLEWHEDVSNKSNFNMFATKVCKQMDSLFTNGRMIHSKNREKMWRNFFILRSSEAFCKQWKTFLEAAGLPVTPAFYQNIMDLVF